MKKEDWDFVDKALSGTFGSIDLRVDGAVVTFQRKITRKNQLGIVTYVNGWFKGIWLDLKAGHPETQHLRLCSRLLHSAKSRDLMKQLSKKRLKEMKFDPDARIHYVSFCWHSVSSIRKHYEKTFKSIELVLPEE